jgi:hypothetical protein
MGNNDGEILTRCEHLADTGESMMQMHEVDDKYLDCQAVCQIAKVLLELDSGMKPMTTLRLEAENFANTPRGATVDELLRVRMLPVLRTRLVY